MQLIILFGVALFIILVTGIMYLLFGEGDIGSTSLMVMSMLIVCAGGFGVFAAVSSIMPSPVFGNEIPQNIIPENLEYPETSLVMSIINEGFCNNDPEYCESGIQTNRDVVLYWQTLNGVGCCATYNCDYDAFAAACILPEFKLYNLYLDDVGIDFSEYNMYKYDYVCSEVIPWNYWNFSNVELGDHIIRIEQKDCENIVSVTNINFSLIEQDEAYIIEVQI